MTGLRPEGGGAGREERRSRSAGATSPRGHPHGLPGASAWDSGVREGTGIGSEPAPRRESSKGGEAPDLLQEFGEGLYHEALLESFHDLIELRPVPLPQFLLPYLLDDLVEGAVSRGDAFHQ